MAGEAQIGERTAPARPPAEPLLRMAAADATSTLDRLHASGLVEQNRVNILSLEAIAEQLGARWAARRERVQDHVERSLERQFGGKSFFHRISDTDYVIAQPDTAPLAGQAKCLNCLREILNHFLGVARNDDIRLHLVTRISNEGVYGEALDVATVEAAAREATEPTPSAGPDRWSPFVATNGQRVRVSCALEPVIVLKTSDRIGYRLVRRVLQIPSDRPLSAAEQRDLSRADIQRIDFATLTRGLDRFRQEGGGARAPMLILPVSYITLSTSEGRATVISLFRQAQGAVRHGLICEICDIEGVPPGALSTAVALIRPFCLYVVGRLNDTPPGRLDNLKPARPKALTAECPQALAGDAEFTGWARSVLTASRPVARSVMLCRLTSTRQMAIAAMLGASHASFRGA